MNPPTDKAMTPTQTHTPGHLDSKEPRFFEVPSPDLTHSRGRRARKTNDAKPAKGHEVTFPVSYRYNGGIIIDGEWYAGYKVGAPILADGWELVSLGVGLNLNARPPYATMYLRPKKVAQP